MASTCQVSVRAPRRIIAVTCVFVTAGVLAGPFTDDSQ